MPQTDKYDLHHIEDPENRNGVEFEKLRFEHAWRHFDMHARQRIQMFYFFLISVAFLCGAFANVSSSQNSELARLSLLVAVAGFAISLVFLALEVRNRVLYSISHRHLKALEENILYPEGFREVYENRAKQSGRLRGILIEDAARRFLLLRHSFLLPLCHIGGAALFFVLFLRVYQHLS
jgi:hypothetical protein